MINIFQINQSIILSLRAILAKTKELKSMKQELEFFRSFLWYANCFNRTSFERSCLATLNTSQMMDVSFYWGVENFSCWKMPRTNQPLLYKYLQISIYSCQTHGFFTMVQFSMQLLTTQFIITIFKFCQQLFLSLSDLRLNRTHLKDLDWISFTEHTESLA